jgi:hypothetical protein
MQVGAFDEEEFFTALATCGARVLLIGRRAMIARGIPVLTADYDLWIDSRDIEILLDAVRPFDLIPNFTPQQARQRGRFVLENDEHVDVLIARRRSTVDGVVVTFEDVWSRRHSVQIGAAELAVPSLADLILTKRWAMRDKDIVDIRLIEALQKQEGEPRDA